MADSPLTPPPNTRTLSLFGIGQRPEVTPPRLDFNLELKLDASTEPGETPALNPKDASQGLTADLYPKAKSTPVLKTFPDLANLKPIELEQAFDLNKPIKQSAGDAAMGKLRLAVNSLSPQLAALLPQSTEQKYMGNQAARASAAAVEADLQKDLNYTVLQVLLGGEEANSKPVLDLLNKIAQGTPPANEAEKQLLASYGYSFDGKNLVNSLKDNQPLSPAELKVLDPKTLANERLKAFSALVAKCKPEAGQPFKPSKAEQDLLAGFGLHVKDGKLLNLLGDRKALAPEQQDQLQTLIREIVRDDIRLSNSGLTQNWTDKGLDAFTPGAGYRSLVGTRSLEAGMAIGTELTDFAASFKGRLGDVDALRRKADANRQEIEAVSADLVRQDAANDVTSTKIDTIVKTEQPRLEQRLSRVDRLSGWLKTLPQGEALDQVLARLTGPERAEISAALEEIGIKPGPDGKVHLPAGMTAAQLGGRVQTALSQTKTELEALERQLQGLRDTLGAGMKKSADFRQKLDRLMNEQNTDLQNLSEADKLLRAGRDELLRYRQNPALWNSLKPEEQAMVERLLKDSEQSIASTGQTLNLGREGLEKAKQIYDEAVAKAERHGVSLSRADKFKLFISLCKQQVDSLSKQLQARLEQIQAGTSDDERLEKLLRQADELEAKAQLVPRPLYTGLDELADQWRELLSSGLREIKAQQSKASERDSFARNIDASRTAKLKESLEYHFKQLDQGSKLSGEQLKHWLEQSIRQFRQQNA